MSLAQSLSRLSDVIGKVLTYPIIETRDHPITVTTLVVAAAIVGAAFWVSRWVQASLRRRLLPRLHVDAGLEFSILRFVHYAVLAAALLLALKIVHVDLTGLAVVAGLLSVGIGFGLQTVASNLISGVILLIERPITVGDRVTVGDINGFVRAISLRSTEVVTTDNISIIVPNSEFVSGRVVNWSHGDPKLRLRIPIGVAHSADVERLSRVLLEVARGFAAVLQDPPPEVRFLQFGRSSLDFEVLVWIDDPRRQERVLSSLHYAIRAALLTEEIEISFPFDVSVVSPLSVSLLSAASGGEPRREKPV